MGAIKLNYKFLNPLAFYLIYYMGRKDIRRILFYGGSSSGKSYSCAQMILICARVEGSNSLVLRKTGATIDDSIYKAFKVAADQLGIKNQFLFSQRKIRCLKNDAEIVFKGLDDSEKIKGLENFRRVLMDELSEFDKEDYEQMNLRLRGVEGQQILATWNPIKETHWIKRSEIDTDEWHDIPMVAYMNGRKVPGILTKVKSIKMNSPKMIMNVRTGDLEEHSPDTVLIQSTYLHNFWVVGSPDGKYGYYDNQCIANFERIRLSDPDKFRVYALGEWGVIRTGSEFFSSFNTGLHVRDCKYDPSLPVHISVDSNVLPYITCTYWQLQISDAQKELRQIGETCAEPPNNTVRKSAKLVAEKLREWNPETVYIHGDASTRAANNIDDQKRSFLDLFIDTLTNEGIRVVDKVGNKNPSVPMSGEFINAVFDNEMKGLSIFIGEECARSIEDYQAVQKDENGAILKTRVKNKVTLQTYEEHGHISDTFRYVVVDLMREAFTNYSNLRKRNIYAKDGALHFFNPETKCEYGREVVYAMPNVNGKFAMVHGKMCGDKWHIVDAKLMETVSTDEIKDILATTASELTILECPPAYFRFVRELRKELAGVRVIKESSDIDRRIAATSDFVKSHLLFSETKLGESAEYSAFVTNMLDYNKDSDSKEASAAMSGFVQRVIKFAFFDGVDVTVEYPNS